MEMRSFKKECGRRLQTLRETFKANSADPHAWSQAEVAEKLGLSVASYAGYEQGTSWPNRNDNFKKICDLFGVGPEYFLAPESYSQDVRKTVAETQTKKETIAKINELQKTLQNLTLSAEEQALLDAYRASHTAHRAIALFFLTGKPAPLKDIDSEARERILKVLRSLQPKLRG